MDQFELIYKEYYCDIYMFILRITSSNKDIAEDLTQECFYQAYISIHRFKGKCSMKTWLCQIAKNCYFNYLRKHDKVVLDISLMEETLIAPIEGEPEYTLVKNMQKELLYKGIKKLSKKQQDVLILRVYFDRSFGEISNLLGIRENTCKVLFHRGKESLIKALN